MNQSPNKAPEPTITAVTIRAPSSTARASRDRGSSLTLGKTMKRRAVTAAELLAQLETDPEYQERLRKRKAELAPILERRRKDEASLVQELREAGFQVESVYDLVNTKASYPEALPVLVRHLDVPHEAVIREGIIRSLAIKYGGIAVEKGLLKHFYSEKEPPLRWVLANALRVAMPLTRRKKHPEIQAVYDWGKRPNKAPEPTPGAVTPRATEGASR